MSGRTREPVVRGLTRPHSARMHRGQVWLEDSGYGAVGFVQDEKLETVTRLPGWTRGLAFWEDVAFAGTSRIIPRYKQYAPGLDLEQSLCGVHAINPLSGEVLGSIVFPYGNQIFAIECVPLAFTTGFPFSAHRRIAEADERLLFYTFQTSVR